MGDEPEKKMLKRICTGLLAHVDAGKTTLSEALLYESGQLRRLGRVDHRDAFLDTDAQERERGITIFSKQARLSLDGLDLTLLDTPGHVDFSSEMERTLQVLDYAILVISGTDGVQGHTATLWRLLARYHIPTFLFVNKMDLAGTDRAALLEQLRSRLSGGCVDFSASDWEESAALCDDGILEKYLEEGTLDDGDVISLIRHRKVFPCWFGSALKLDGVVELLQGIEKDTDAELGTAVDLVVSLGPEPPKTQFLASLQVTYPLMISFGPGAESSEVQILIRLKQTVNGKVTYTKLAEPKAYSASTMLDIRLDHIRGADGVSTGEVEIVDLTNNVVLTSYNVNFVETEV